MAMGTICIVKLHFYLDTINLLSNWGITVYVHTCIYNYVHVRVRMCMHMHSIVL